MTKNEERLKKFKNPNRKPLAIVPAAIQKVTKKVLKTKQLTKNHNKGKCDVEGVGLVNVWENKGVEYFVKIPDMEKLKHQAPKVYVTQDKNVKLLLYLTQHQQFNATHKSAEASFTLKEYAKLRGYTDDEIAKGGKFFDELKRDLYSGAYTIYRAPIKINGKDYTLHGAFYTLTEPKSRKDKWTIEWNAWYAKYVLNLLNGNAIQYFGHQLKEISDRTTTEHPYLHFFYNEYICRQQHNLQTKPVKVYNLLADMGVKDEFLTRPSDCFRILMQCLAYFGTNYPHELESVLLYNNIYNEKEIKRLQLRSLNDLEKWTYEEFREVLKTIDVTDIREALISFCRPLLKALPMSQTTLCNDDLFTGQITESFNVKQSKESELINEIFKWAEQWEKFNVPIKKIEDRVSATKFLNDCIKQIGYNRVNDLFLEESTAYNASAWNLLMETLPSEMKKLRRKK